MKRRSWIALLAVACLGLIGFFVVAWRPAIRPAARSGPPNFPPESISRGEILAALGHCASCHTREGGEPYAGGFGVNTPFGVIYGSNITPDPDTGIGLWSREAFDRAMRQGVSLDGSHLFPAFPYYAFTKLSDADLEALYAFIMTRPAVRSTIPASTLPFPLSVRALQGGWKLLFFSEGRFRPNPAKSAEWNRGLYLADALGDCAGCHTPRNFLGGETSATYGGALVDGWIAPSLTRSNPSPIPWTVDELVAYLRTGTSPLHGATAATMTWVTREAMELPVVPDSDVRAIAVYFTDVAGVNASAAQVESVTRKALATSAIGLKEDEDPGAVVYAGACLGCHFNSGPVPLPARPELALNSAITLSEPTNFIQVVLNGVGAKDGARGLVMPAYASSLSDGQIATLATYLRRTRTQLPPWRDVETKVAEIRRSLPPTP